MKKPLMLVPPAQAEALYDAALHEARPRQPPTSAFPRPPRSWDTLEWDEDDGPSPGGPHPAEGPFKAQH